MTRPVVTKDEMRKRIAVFRELKSSSMPLIDAVLPQYNREIFNVIGRGVTEDPRMSVAISDARDFHVAMIKAGPGKGSGLHTHETLEVFMPMSGTWSVQWGDQGENELTLNTFDVISIPTMRVLGPQVSFGIGLRGARFSAISRLTTIRRHVES